MRTLKEILSAYRMIRQEYENSIRREAEAFDKTPYFDAFVSEVDAETERLFGAPMKPENKKQMQWSRIVDAITKRQMEAFAFFSLEEMEMLNEHMQALIDEAHALCMDLQTGCPRLWKSFTTDDLGDLERHYKAQFHAMERLNRRWDDWEDIAALIQNAKRLAEQTPSGPVN